MRDAVGRDACDAAEDDGEHQAREHQRDEELQRAEQGQLVAQLKGALGKQPDQVAVTPELPDAVEVDQPVELGDFCIIQLSFFFRIHRYLPAF